MDNSKCLLFIKSSTPSQYRLIYYSYKSFIKKYFYFRKLYTILNFFMKLFILICTFHMEIIIKPGRIILKTELKLLYYFYSGGKTEKIQL